MVWFKVDDTLHSHPKARRAGMAAIGMWSLAGSYAGQYVTEGFVPEWFVSSWPNGRKLAAALVAAGMWSPGVRDGEAGWYFHDWSHYQPSKEEVDRERAHNRERQKRFREKRAEARRNGVTNDVTSSVTNAVSNGTPSRPDPSRPEQGVTQLGGERPETLRSVGATRPTPNEARCTAHIGVADPGPCRGCGRERERIERQIQRDTEQQRQATERAAIACTRCDGVWITDEHGQPTRRKCDHRRTA